MHNYTCPKHYLIFVTLVARAFRTFQSVLYPLFKSNLHISSVRSALQRLLSLFLKWSSRVLVKEGDLPKDSRPTEMQLQFRSPETLLHASTIEPLSQRCNRSWFRFFADASISFVDCVSVLTTYIPTVTVGSVRKPGAFRQVCSNGCAHITWDLFRFSFSKSGVRERWVCVSNTPPMLLVHTHTVNSNDLDNLWSERWQGKNVWWGKEVWCFSVLFLCGK